MRQDPVVAIETQADNLRRLKALYIDCGEKDQFNLLYGARRFVRRPNELGITHRYEEFPDNHTGVDYRMDESLPFSPRRCPEAVRPAILRRVAAPRGRSAGVAMGGARDLG
jgi:hypothetical protein